MSNSIGPNTLWVLKHQHFFNFIELHENVKLFAKNNGNEIKIKNSHEIPKKVIEKAKDKNEKLAKNLEALKYKEVVFCCKTYDLNLRKKGLLVDCSIMQCPALVRAVLTDLDIDDKDYEEGSVEKALVVTRIIENHSHEYYENALKLKRQSKVQKSTMGIKRARQETVPKEEIRNTSDTLFDINDPNEEENVHALSRTFCPRIISLNRRQLRRLVQRATNEINLEIENNPGNEDLILNRIKENDDEIIRYDVETDQFITNEEDVEMNGEIDVLEFVDTELIKNPIDSISMENGVVKQENSTKDFNIKNDTACLNFIVDTIKNISKDFELLKSDVAYVKTEVNRMAKQMKELVPSRKNNFQKKCEKDIKLKVIETTMV